MIFILEGPDGSGKTTLANKLCEQYNAHYVHFGVPTEEERPKLWQIYRDALLDLRSKYDNVVIDRMFISTVVYGTVMRGKSELTWGECLELEQAVKHDAMLIYCTGEPHIMWDELQSRGEDYVLKRGDYMRIFHTYIDCMESQPHILPVFKYNRFAPQTRY